MITYIAGLLTVAFLPGLGYALGAVLLLPLTYYSRLRFWTLTYLLGVLVAVVYGSWQLQHRLPLSLDRTDVALSGVVVSLPEVTERRTRFILQVNTVQSDQPALQRLRRIRISDYRSFTDVAAAPVHAGDYVQVTVRLRSPHFLQNPYAFDLERHFLSSGWDASATLRAVHQHTEGAWMYRLRDDLRSRIQARFHEQQVASWLLPAVTLGDRTSMTDAHWHVLQRTGTAHLLVVSGLHIAVISGAGILLGRLFNAALLCLRIETTRLRFFPLLLAFLLATAYAWLAGFNLPVQRAWIMVSIFLLGEWQLLRWSGWTRWRFALCLVVTLQPLAVLQPGAWMSFAAVATLLLMTDVYRGVRHTAWLGLVRAQWMIFVGLLPVMAWVFQQLSLSAPFINLLAIPVFSVFVMALPILLPLVLLDLFWMTQLVEKFLEIFWLGLVYGTEWQWGYRPLSKPNIWIVLFTLPLVLTLLLPLPLRWKLLGILCFLPLLSPRQQTLPEGDFRALVFDAGQGLAVWVETRDVSLMYDTGPGYPDGGSAWKYAMAPWFTAQNRRSLTHLVVSHRDLDHAGGMDDLFDQLRVSQLFSGSEDLQQQGFDSCHELQRWVYNQVSFRFLTQPPATDASENERSCVLEVRGSQCSLLLPGDAGHPTEYDLVRSGRLQPVTWLVAGHHGSASSSSDVFIEQLQPEAVIYTAGFGNRYGHPADVVSERFRQRQIDEYNTATSGAVWLESTDKGCQLLTQRQRKRRYWTSG